MKRGVIVAVVGVLLFCAGLAAYRRKPPTATAHLSITFLHYTNDFARIRSQMYTIPDDSDKSLAVFKMEIARINGFFGFSGGKIQLHSPNGWNLDVNHSLLLPSVFEPNQSGVGYGTLTVPVPAGTNAWRYSVLCVESPQRPVWQQKAINFLNQVGFKIRDLEYTVESPEITR